MQPVVYILINPSLPGLLKIGMTNRTAEERAAELSSGTNMPTKFLVAYEENVPDGIAAEKSIHDELTQLGYRVNDSREFFNVPLKIAIQVMSRIADYARAEAPSQSIQSVPIEGSQAIYYLSKGFSAYSGSPGELQDYAVAHSSFKMAMDLGALEAPYWLATLYMNGCGVKPSFEKAMEILNRGVDRGDINCYERMWMIYAGKSHIEVFHQKNADVCFSRYLNARKESGPTDYLQEYLDHFYYKTTGTLYGSLFTINDFPGEHSKQCIKLWANSINLNLLLIRNSRINGLTMAELEENELLKKSSFDKYDLIQVIPYFSTRLTPSSVEELLKIIFEKIELQDMEYAFSHLKKGFIDEFEPYLLTVAV